MFISGASAAGNTGFYLLSVPAERITPGRPLELRVTGAGGDPAAWFMIKSYRDTLAVRAHDAGDGGRSDARRVAQRGPLAYSLTP